MKRTAAVLLLALAMTAVAHAQDSASSPAEKRSWVGRILHPFGGGSKTPPKYKNAKLRGLLLDLQISPQPVKLSEVRHLEVKLTVSNQSKHSIGLDFPTEQRIEIYLRDTSETVLTKFSDNHAFADKPASILINPQEHVEYSETIATRDLTPDKVFIVEAFFPKYPELMVRQKFMTAP
ncbi:MAG: Intracellular proteinase inhibitor [Verrucomicrobiota bacterium]|jgi:hypothetical protein